MADTESQEKIKKEHATSLQKNRSSVKYPSAQKDIDINYYVSGQSLKEDIVLHRVPTARSFSFDFTYTGLQAVLQPDNSVFFNDNTGRTIFIVPAPYMFDSDVGYSTDIAVTVEQTEGGCRYTLTPSREWLEDEQRVYPVTVDPQVYTTQNSSYIHDNGVQQSNPSTNYITYDRMYVGSAVGRLEGRMYFKLTQWPTASLLNTHTITNATLRFYYYPQADWQTGYDMDIEVYTPAAVWNTNTITWNNQPTNVEQWITSLYIGDSRRKDNGYDNYDVTTWVKARYANPSGDKGITLRPYTVVNATNRVCYISSDYYTNSSLRPFITIEYTDRLFGLVGIPHPNHEHTHFMNNSIPSSYVKSRNTNIDGNTALGVLRASRAFISRSHGGKTSISCANNTYMTRADILALPSGALSHMQLVYYGACSTGEGGASAENLVNATYDRGARTVIGFTTEVDCGSTNTWTAEFMEQISNNHTIYYAMIQADNEAGTGGNTHLRLVRGLQEVTVS